MRRDNLSVSNQALLSGGLIALLIIIDQAIKIWVKTSMVETQMLEVTSWFKIYFLENEGMAYGIQLGSKLLLTLFRIVAMSLLLFHFVRLVRTGLYSLGFLLVLSTIIAGGFGNIIDCLFYGEIFSSSAGQVATWTTWGQGYGDFLHGKVVDMFYFPIIRTTYPDWFPFYGGEPFVFFSPIFNFADACISVGAGLLLLCYMPSFAHAFDLKMWDKPFPRREEAEAEETAEG